MSPEPHDVLGEFGARAGGERNAAARPLAWRIAALIVLLAIVGGSILGVMASR